MKEKILDAVVSNIDELAEFIDSQLSQLMVTESEKMKLQIAAEELFVNVASYAYAPGKGKILILAEVDPKDNKIELTFTDWGVPFNPLDREDPDITLPAEKRRIGGLGIFMVKKEADELDYWRKDQTNNVRLEKKFKGR